MFVAGQTAMNSPQQNKGSASIYQPYLLAGLLPLLIRKDTNGQSAHNRLLQLRIQGQRHLPCQEESGRRIRDRRDHLGRRDDLRPIFHLEHSVKAVLRDGLSLTVDTVDSGADSGQPSGPGSKLHAAAPGAPPDPGAGAISSRTPGFHAYQRKSCSSSSCSAIC